MNGRTVERVVGRIGDVGLLLVGGTVGRVVDRCKVVDNLGEVVGGVGVVDIVGGCGGGRVDLTGGKNGRTGRV